MGDVITQARRLFARRRAEAMMRQLRFMKTRIAPTGALFEQPNEDQMFFVIRDLPEVTAQARREKRIPLDDEGLPKPEWITPIWNLVGGVYGQLPLPYREIFLRGVLNYLDNLKHERCAQRHLRRINHPLLVGDIAINRRAYWCGLSTEGTLLSRCTSSAQLSLIWPDALASFWLCVAVLCNSDVCNAEARRWYLGEFPELVDRSLDFVAAIVHDKAVGQAAAQSQPLDHAIKAVCLRDFDASLFKAIVQRVEQRNWLLLPK